MGKENAISLHSLALGLGRARTGLEEIQLVRLNKDQETGLELVAIESIVTGRMEVHEHTRQLHEQSVVSTTSRRTVAG